MRGAINNMSQGLCMFDGNERLVVCNRRYMQMYNLSADIVTPGSTLHSCSNTGSGTGPLHAIRLRIGVS